MPLDALGVSTQVRQMGDLLVERFREGRRQLELAQSLVAEYADQWEELADFAETTKERVAVPTGPLDETVPTPPRLAQYTALASDGSEIEPDRHGAGGDYYLVNVGWARIAYGQPGRDAELKTRSTLSFRDEDLYIVDPRNPRRQVPIRDRHLDALRTVKELEALADLAEAEREQHADVAGVALVDGTLLFSVLEERPQDFLRAYFYGLYVAQLDRLRASGVALAAYASRTRGIDLVNLLRAKCHVEPAACATCSSGPRRTTATSGPDLVCCLRGATDAMLLGPMLESGERSAIFRVRSNVHDPYYGEHRIHFFLLDTGTETARVEVPAWVARDRVALDRVHAVLVDQCVKGQGYPAVLARADDRAVITTGDRLLLDSLVRQELARRGLDTRPSAKLRRKQVRTV